MTRALREDERDEIECVKHYIKYINTKPNVQLYEIWSAVLKLEEIGNKYVMSNIASEQELSELICLDEMKDLASVLFSRINEELLSKEEL